MDTVFKRLSAFILCVALVLGIPSTALAAEWDGEKESQSVEVGVGESAEAQYNEEIGASQAQTNVDIMIYSGVEIIGQTEDTVILEGDDLQLGIAVRGFSPFTYVWEISYDEGQTWEVLTDAENVPTYDIIDAQYMPNDRYRIKPYHYRVTVYDVSGHSDSTVIKVLVGEENEYRYRRIEHTRYHIAASAWMHFITELKVKPLTDTESAVYQELEKHLAPGCLPGIAANVELYNKVDGATPYMGNVELEFPVGEEYNGQTLRVLHLLNGEVVEYSGVVKDGILYITVEEMGDFMVELPAKNAHTITVSASDGGSVTPSGTVTVEEGADKTFVILPDEGYIIGEVLVDGEPVEITGNSCTLTNIKEDHTLDVTFVKSEPSDEEHTVVISGGPNGTVSPEGFVKVKDGDSLVISITPNSGYEVKSALVNGVEHEVVGGYLTLPSVTGTTTVDVTFKKSSGGQTPIINRTITASAGAGGVISPAGENAVNYGGDMYFYIIPDEGYVIDKVLVDGREVTMTDNVYHFINVVDHHTIEASFRPDDGSGGIGGEGCYTVSAESGPNGAISPVGDVFVTAGGSQTFHFKPDSGYAVSKIIVNGEVVAINGLSYTINDIQADTTIRVEFVKVGNIQTGDYSEDVSYTWCWILLGVAGGVAILMIILILLRRKEEDEESSQSETESGTQKQ